MDINPAMNHDEDIINVIGDTEIIVDVLHCFYYN